MGRKSFPDFECRENILILVIAKLYTHHPKKNQILLFGSCHITKFMFLSIIVLKM